MSHLPDPTAAAKALGRQGVADTPIHCSTTGAIVVKAGKNGSCPAGTHLRRTNRLKTGGCSSPAISSQQLHTHVCSISTHGYTWTASAMRHPKHKKKAANPLNPLPHTPMQCTTTNPSPQIARPQPGARPYTHRPTAQAAQPSTQ